MQHSSLIFTIPTLCANLYFCEGKGFQFLGNHGPGIQYKGVGKAQPCHENLIQERMLHVFFTSCVIAIQGKQKTWIQFFLYVPSYWKILCLPTYEKLSFKPVWYVQNNSIFWTAGLYGAKQTEDMYVVPPYRG